MTKEIIIDGVNVAECDYVILPENQCPNKPMPYAKETSCIACKEHNTKLNFCKNNPNCYFKQLQRLKQENEQLKDALKTWQYSDTQHLIKINDYKQALEEIREAFRECSYNASFMNNCSEKCKFYKSCNGELSAIENKINEALND